MGKGSLGRSAQVSRVIHIYYVSFVGRFHHRIDHLLIPVDNLPLASLLSKIKFYDNFVKFV